MNRRHFLAFPILAGVAPALADDPETVLRVEVKNHRGKAVERASVVLVIDEGRAISKFGKKKKLRWEMRTDTDGIAKFPPFPQGPIRLQVLATGYQTFGEKYEINEPEKTIVISLLPPQPQHSVHQ